MNHKRKTVAVAFLVLALIAPTAAQGQTTQTKAIAAIEAVSPESLTNLDVLANEDTVKARLHTPKNTAAIFSKRSTGVSLWAREIDKDAIDGSMGSSVAVLTSKDKVDIVPLAKTDGSVQTLLVFQSEKSAQNVAFNLDVPPDAQVALLPSGDIAVTSSNGSLLAGVAAPWAKDSQGRSVETWFEFADGVLTQHVAHSAHGYAYPIVADPWLGIDLYNKPYVTFETKGYRINVKPTSWGSAWVGIGTWFAHRDEVVTKLGTQAWRWTATIQEQFYCHLAGYPLGLPEYNMESWSPLVPWQTSLTSYQCNPDKGTWY